MRFKGFIGPSYQLNSVEIDSQRCINLYPQLNEMQTGKDGEIASLIGTPGLRLINTVGSGPGRGLYKSTVGTLYKVTGNTVYSVDPATGTGTALGTLQTTNGQVGMADNGFQLVIVDGPFGYYIDFTAPTVLVQITDLNFLGSNTVTYQDGYFIFCAPNSKEFYLSDLNAITFLAPADTAKNGYPDNIVCTISVNRNLWLFGEVTTEVWFDSGDNLNPFAFVPGSLMQYGCAATFSVAKLFNTVFWIGADLTGSGMVYMANAGGYTPVRISTHAVELAFRRYKTISDAVAYTYQENGHQFYVLNFPTASATWCYDCETSLWHERAYLTNGQLQRQRQNGMAFVNEMYVCDDYANGNLYEMNSSVYSDNSNAIPRIRIAPQLSNDMNRMFIARMQLDIESGVGIDGIGQGVNPQAILQFSNDGGHTYSDEMWASFGAIGATKKRAEWRRLGMSRDRVFKVTITDPVKVILLGAELDVTGGNS